MKKILLLSSHIWIINIAISQASMNHINIRDDETFSHSLITMQ